MTRVYPLVTIGVLSSDNAAAQLKRLAEQCGVSDADLAAIPDGPAERRSAKPLGDWARRATRAGSPAHRSENHAGRNAGGHSSACGHNGHKHGCYLRPGVVGAPGPERIRSGNHAEGHARRREFAHIHNADEHSGHLRPGHVAGAEPEKVTRRRRWAASGYLPPQIAARFTLAEQSVLSVISKQHMEHGKEVRLGVRAGTPLPRPKKRDKRRDDRLKGVDELAGQTCPECKGTGRGVKPERFGYRLSNAGHWEKFCPACNGTGKRP
jgi:hypothetical protein